MSRTLQQDEFLKQSTSAFTTYFKYIFYQKWTFLVVHRTTFHKKQAFQIGHHFFGCLFSCCKDKSRAILTALFDFVSWQKLNAPSKIFYYLFGPSKLLRSQAGSSAVAILVRVHGPSWVCIWKPFVLNLVVEMETNVFFFLLILL